MDTGMDTDCEMRSAIHERCTKSQQKQKKTDYCPVCDFVLLLFAYAIFVSLVLLFSRYFVLLFLLYEMFISPGGDTMVLLLLLFPLLLFLRFLLLLESSGCL